jgi:hypothetical protein
MGQYYKIIILDDKSIVKAWIHPWDHSYGNKLLEHSWIGNKFINMIEYLISQNGPFYMSRIIWCGDYAEHDLNMKNQYNESCNLYDACDQQFIQSKFIFPNKVEKSPYRYVLNHTKKLYIDKEYSNKNIEYGDYDIDTYKIHPLPLLVLDKYTRRGGGDYFGNNQQLCGTWARDVISIENNIPEGFTELVCDFS